MVGPKECWGLVGVSLVGVGLWGAWWPLCPIWLGGVILGLVYLLSAGVEGAD